MATFVANFMAFAIDLATQQVIALADLPEHVPARRGGKKLHKSTPFRWAKRGHKAADDTIVRLPTIRVAGTLCTSVEGFQWFCERLSEGGGTLDPVRTSTARRKVAAKVDRELDALGVGIR